MNQLLIVAGGECSATLVGETGGYSLHLNIIYHSSGHWKKKPKNSRSEHRVQENTCEWVSDSEYFFLCFNLPSGASKNIKTCLQRRIDILNTLADHISC